MSISNRRMRSIVNHRSVTIPAGQVELRADLNMPDNARGVVLFAHGSGSGRHSPRNQFVADILNEHGLGTLLADLLTTAEEKLEQDTLQFRFDIPMLADRLVAITRWAMQQPELKHLKMGYFGASTGAAAALNAAARQGSRICAIVSRGGRPDLAEDSLPFVSAPTLLIVGGHDPEVLRLNKKALEKLNRHCAITVVPNATHLFEEPGALDDVAQLAAGWLEQHLE